MIDKPKFGGKKPEGPKFGKRETVIPAEKPLVPLSEEDRERSRQSLLLHLRGFKDQTMDELLTRAEEIWTLMKVDPHSDDAKELDVLVDDIRHRYWELNKRRPKFRQEDLYPGTSE